MRGFRSRRERNSLLSCSTESLRKTREHGVGKNQADLGTSPYGAGGLKITNPTSTNTQTQTT